MLNTLICDGVSWQSEKAQMRSRGRMLDWSQAQPNAWGLFPLDRALIGGTQPIHGWWAPDALRYKNRSGGRRHTNLSSPCSSPTRQTLGHPIGLRSGVGKHHCTTSSLPHRRRSVPVEARRTMGSTSPPRQHPQHGRHWICSHHQRRSKPYTLDLHVLLPCNRSSLHMYITVFIILYPESSFILLVVDPVRSISYNVEYQFILVSIKKVYTCTSNRNVCTSSNLVWIHTRIVNFNYKREATTPVLSS